MLSEAVLLTTKPPVQVVPEENEPGITEVWVYTLLPLGATSPVGQLKLDVPTVQPWSMRASAEAGVGGVSKESVTVVEPTALPLLVTVIV